MKTVNKVILVGHLGADPEVRYTSGETARAVANFSVATTEKWMDGNTAREDTQWHRCVVWGKLGELAGEFLRKGSKVYIEGRMKHRKWTDKEKIERVTTEVMVDEFSALDDAPEKAAPVDSTQTAKRKK